MRWYANQLGYGEDADFWATVGLLHDIDFEQWPEQHCVKAPELLGGRPAAARSLSTLCAAMATASAAMWKPPRNGKGALCRRRAHGSHRAAALMRPSKSVQDMELKSIKKKFKDKKFAAGCSRDVIITGAERLGWELDALMEKDLGSHALL